MNNDMLVGMLLVLCLVLVFALTVSVIWLAFRLKAAEVAAANAIMVIGAVEKSLLASIQEVGAVSAGRFDSLNDALRRITRVADESHDDPPTTFRTASEFRKFAEKGIVS